jgi:TetR/AcrR family fatty acid metabolism transcriptional regulator
VVPVALSKESVVEQFRRDTLRDAARRVIARRGLAGASMAAIAEEAGVAKGTLYLYFQDRDALVDHTAGRIYDVLLDRLRGVLAGGGPLRHSLRELVRTKLAFFDENQEFLRAYMALRAGGPGDARRRRRRRPQYARYLELLEEHLAGAARRGEMKRFDPSRVALFLAEGTAAVLQRRLEETRRDPEEDVEWIVDLLLDGLCPPERT